MKLTHLGRKILIKLTGQENITEAYAFPKIRMVNMVLRMHDRAITDTRTRNAKDLHTVLKNM